jgi:hypothetical protein
VRRRSGRGQPGQRTPAPFTGPHARPPCAGACRGTAPHGQHPHRRRGSLRRLGTASICTTSTASILHALANLLVESGRGGRLLDHRGLDRSRSRARHRPLSHLPPPRAAMPGAEHLPRCRRRGRTALRLVVGGAGHAAPLPSPGMPGSAWPSGRSCTVDGKSTARCAAAVSAGRIPSRRPQPVRAWLPGGADGSAPGRRGVRSRRSSRTTGEPRPRWAFSPRPTGGVAGSGCGRAGARRASGKARPGRRSRSG